MSPGSCDIGCDKRLVVVDAYELSAEVNETEEYAPDTVGNRTEGFRIVETTS